MSTQNFTKKMTCAALVLVLSTAFAGNTIAGSREQAKRIHDRIAGVPPSDAVLTAMQADIVGGDANAATLRALANPNFYRVTLKNFVTPWTNEAQTVFEPLNDYTATVIGIIRDDTDFREILYGDIIYMGAGSLGLPTLVANNNDHYKAMEDQGIDLGDDTKLIGTFQNAALTQSSITGIPAAGVLTTRAAAKAFFVDGTNRAMFRFTMLNHLCKDMEQVKDTSYNPDRIRQDVSRSPGGDSRIFMNACVGCHTGMDPMTQAFAYYDFEYSMVNNEPDYDNGQMVYNAAGVIDIGKDGNPTGSRVQEKFHINANNFEFGFVTPNDNWDNYWRTGSNSALGWDIALTGSGAGASSMGEELASSTTFARCQVEKVFKTVCLRTPVDAADRGQVDTMLGTFQGNGYKLKQVFADSAVFCMGS